MKRLKDILHNFNRITAKKLRAMSLLKRLIALVTFLILVPTLFINIVLYYQYARNIERETMTHASQYIRGVSDIVRQKLAVFENIAQSIYTDSDIRQKLLEHKNAVESGDFQSADECKRFINNSLYNTMQNDYILNVEIVSINDEFTQISYENTHKGGRLTDKDSFFKSDIYSYAVESRGLDCWYDLKSTDDIVVNQISGYTYDTNLMLLKSIPFSWNDEPLGVIIINVSTRLFTDDFLPVDSLSENLFLASERGGISTLTEDSRITLDEAQINDIIIGDESMEMEHDGISYQIISKEVMSTGIYVIQMINERNITQTISSIRNLIIIINAVFVVFGILLSYIFMKSINDPLEKLIRVMDRVGNDNEVNILYEDDADDEIAYLGSKYNLMVKRIDSLIKSVYQMQIINQSEELRRREAQIDALQMQINPHFIYNMLEILRWKSIEQSGGENQVSRIIQAFAANLRRVTKETAKIIPLYRELEHVSSYVEVLNLVFEKNIKLDIDVSDDLKRCSTINFLLQPLVENSVMHGFKGENNGLNIIQIKAEKQNGDLLIHVKDNGRGMTDEKLHDLKESIGKRQKNKKSIGIYNINERIKLMFGEKYGLTVNKNKDMGTEVIICIPYNERGRADEEDYNSR